MSSHTDTASIVRIEFTSGTEEPPEVPDLDDGMPRGRLWSIVLLLAIASGLLIWLDRTTPARDDDAAPQDRAPVEPTVAPDPFVPSLNWDTFSDRDVAQVVVDVLVAEPTRVGETWFALRGGSGGSSLVRSDDGLDWRFVSTSLGQRNLFGLTSTDSGGLRTLANRRLTDPPRYALDPASSADGFRWQREDDGSFPVSGSRPVQTVVAGDTTVIVDDRPIEITSPPDGLPELLAEHVSSATAHDACVLSPASYGGTQWFDVIGCDGTLLDRVTGGDDASTDALASIARLFAAQQVVTVQIGETAPDVVELGIGRQVLAIEATSTGFIATVVDEVATDGAPTPGGEPVRLVRWSRGGGLVDVTDGLDIDSRLSVWTANDLVVNDEQEAFLAASGVIFRSEPPYTSWSAVMPAPISGSGSLSAMRIGPHGSAAIFQDVFSHVWVGRVGVEWVRAPQLDSGMVRDVVLATDGYVVAAVEFDQSEMRLVRLPMSTQGYDPPAPVGAEVSAHLLTSISPFDGGWIGAARDNTSLIESVDGGTSWRVSTAGHALDGVVAVGQTSDGQPAALTARTVDDDQILETLVWRDVWVLDATRPPIVVDAAATIVSARVASDTIVVTDQAWDRPVPEVSEVLVAFTDSAVASSTCSIIRAFGDDAIRFDLLDCDRTVLDSIGVETGGSTDGDAKLAVAAEVLQSRHVIHVSRPDTGLHAVPLGPSQYVQAVEGVDDGFVALTFDSLAALREPSLLFAQALSGGMIAWDASADASRVIELPIGTSAWSTNTLTSTDDGEVVFASNQGVYAAPTPFTSWDLLTTGPFIRLTPGQRFGTALHGAGLFVDDPGGPGLFWATCCDDASNSFDAWESVASNGGAFSRALIASDDSIVFHGHDGEAIAVPR